MCVYILWQYSCGCTYIKKNWTQQTQEISQCYPFPQVNDFFSSSYPVNVPGTEDQQLAEVTKVGQMSLNESVLSVAPLYCATRLSV